MIPKGRTIQWQSWRQNRELTSYLFFELIKVRRLAFALLAPQAHLLHVGVGVDGHHEVVFVGHFEEDVKKR